MTPAQESIARRFVAWAGWEWRVGMRASPGNGFADGWRVVESRAAGDGCLWPGDVASWMVPDITDDLTLAAIEALLRDRLGAVHVWCEPVEGEWYCVVADDANRTVGRKRAWGGPTHAAALLAACEATP